MNNTLFKFPLFVTLLFSLLLISCEEDPTRIDFSDVPEPFSIENPVSVDTTESGLIIYVVEEGSGEFEVEPRDRIDFYYTKRYRNKLDRIISSSYANGITTPWSENVTTSGSPRDVIRERQFREGIIGMKEGEKRVLILTPPIQPYAGSSFSYSNETIWIDVELDRILVF